MTTFSIVFVATFVALQVVIAVFLRLSGVFRVAARDLTDQPLPDDPCPR